MRSVITKAKELITELGHEEAIKFFENRIKEIGDSEEFSDICKISGCEVAIDFIKADSQKDK